MKSKNLGFLMMLTLLTSLSLFIGGFVTAKTYSASFYKGTDTYIVEDYDKNEWEEVIESTLTPDDFFGGDANKKNAKAKNINLGWYDNETNVYEMLTGLYIPENSLASLSSLKEEGVNRSTINDAYNTTIESWKIYQSLWSFTEDDFEVDADRPNYILYVFKNAERYKTGLDIYHQWSDEMNSSYEVTFPNLTGDDFIWQLILKGQYFPSPISSYLTELVDSLECENTTTDENSLIIERNGEKSYTVNVNYASDGSYSQIEILGEDEGLIYRISQNNSHQIFTWILLGIVIGVFSIAFMYRRYKLKMRRE
ncbi:MAG: hypothetical protein R6U96_09570 [Promethearchaeia archaeon]